MVKTVDAKGLSCPQPLIRTKNALKEMKEGTLEVLVSDEIAVQNLLKFGGYSKLKVSSEKLGEKEYRVTFVVEENEKSGSGEAGKAADRNATGNVAAKGTAVGNAAGESVAAGATAAGNAAGKSVAAEGTAAGNAAGGATAAEGTAGESAPQDVAGCLADQRQRGSVVVLGAGHMGEGDEELGRILMKGYVYALTQLDQLPEKILLYNGGAKLSTAGAETLEDLKTLEAAGVEILTCGTCLNYYGLSGQLAVGGVTNMYDIAQTMLSAGLVVRP